LNRLLFRHQVSIFVGIMASSRRDGCDRKHNNDHFNNALNDMQFLRLSVVFGIPPAHFGNACARPDGRRRRRLASS
jgi:hypothetical protein